MIMNKILSSFLVLLFALFLTNNSNAQFVEASTKSELETSIEQRAKLRNNSALKNYPVRNVGPVVMSGRVSDIAVHPDNSRIFYVGYASGGVFKTTNSGNTMTPIFDHQDALGIGDIAISKANHDIIWVGTGENNSSRSSYAGAGVFKSMDAGETWEYTGLRNTQHIGRIITHPTDANIAWVGSVGALYSTNSERGVYKTTDGGKNWNKTLFVNDSTGVIDLVIHPTNPDILWAATWEKDRKAWNFKEGGNGSAVYKSTDGGENWSKSVSGLPQGSFVGRIGLDISISNPDVIYAIVDNQFEMKEERENDSDALSQTSFVEMSVKDFVNIDNKKLETFLRRNRFPEKYTAKSVKADVENGKYKPAALGEFLGDANAALFDTSIKGLEVYRSDDGGESWKITHDYEIPGVYNTYGYYFGELRVDPNDENTIYALGVPFIKSTDGGKNWEIKANNDPVHADQQALWINPNDSEHLLLGNDGGLYESHDGGENFIHHNTEAVGQFYTVSVDMEKPYNIYGGLQDNGTFVGPSTSTPNRNRPWERLFGGDGMHVYANPTNSDIVYVGFQYGNYFRLDREKGTTTGITPRHDVGEPRYRYNWNTPVNLSHHNPDVVYFGSQRLSRSLDRGETWTAISPDLTNDHPNGDVPYSTISTIAESPLDFNQIWVGTDDGNIQLTRDGGSSWTNVTGSIQKDLWVSEVHASVHEKGTAYVSLNGYRFDDFDTYLYKTTDFGKTWKSVKGNLPNEVANVIVQDPVVPSILYAGLDHGTYISFNDGKEWHYLNQVPNVASYDMVVHPREYELVIGTHGRSIWVMDVKPLHKLSERMDERITGFSPDDIRHSGRWGSQFSPYRDPFNPSVDLMYFISNKKGDSVEITIEDKEGDKIFSTKQSSEYGFNIFEWDLVIDTDSDGKKTYIQKGEYTIEFKVGKSTHTTSFNVK
jgi:photosystem II stability/assembly factor-like uncharacterized protein